MTVALLAPISESDYRTYPVLALPSDFTGDKVIQLLNNAWATIEKWANQPLTAAANTDIYEFPSKQANVMANGNLRIVPRFTPLISVTTIKNSYSIVQGGWTPVTLFDVIGDSILCYDSFFTRGDSGLLQVAYTSGYAIVPNDLKEACALMAALFLSAGFFPTQGGVGITPDWADGADRQKYYRVRQIVELHQRKF